MQRKNSVQELPPEPLDDPRQYVAHVLTDRQHQQEVQDIRPRLLRIIHDTTIVSSFVRLLMEETKLSVELDNTNPSSEEERLKILRLINPDPFVEPEKYIDPKHYSVTRVEPPHFPKTPHLSHGE